MRRAPRLFLIPDRAVRAAELRANSSDRPPLRWPLTPRHARLSLTQDCLIPKSPSPVPPVCQARYLFFLPALPCLQGSSEYPPAPVCLARVPVGSLARV